MLKIAYLSYLQFKNSDTDMLSVKFYVLYE